MALNLILAKNVLYKDGQAAGDITFPDGRTLQARYRVYPTKNNLVTIQTFYPVSITPRRSAWADHSREWLIQQGIPAADVAFVSPLAAFTAIGWVEDERHVETNESPLNPEFGDKTDSTVQFKIIDDGSVVTQKYTPDATIQQQELINKTAQEKALVAQDAIDLQKKNDQLWKYIKIGGFFLLGTALTIGGILLYKKNAKDNAKRKKDELKGK